MKSISEWTNKVHKLAREKGWYDTLTSINSSDVVEKACNNFHNEISELHEAHRKRNLFYPCDKGIQLTCLEEELADIMIRIMDFASYMGVDLENAISVKHEFNKTRSYRHGNKES